MRKLKALGLVLVAALALGATGVSAAQAELDGDFNAAADAVKIDIWEDGVVLFETALGTFTCTKATAHATYEGETNTLAGTAAEYGGCTAHTLLGAKPMTVFPQEGCQLIFTAGTYTSSQDTSHGIVHTCGMTIVVYDNEGHTDKRCEMHVEPAPDAVTYDNVMTEGEVHAVTGTLEAELPMIRTDLNKLGCNNEVTETANYQANFWLKATNASEELVDFTVTGTR